MEYELYHFGILGMKWGIRRYQNKDGSLTAAGKKRYSSDSPQEKKEEAPKENEYFDDKQVGMSTDNFYSRQSNKGKIDYSFRIEDNPQCHALAERFMSGEFNKSIYKKILDETYDGYLDWCKQGDIHPVDRIEYVKGLRKAGFNSGGVNFFPREGIAILDIYVNDNDYFWGHVFGLEISDKHGVQKRQVSLEG